MDFRWDYKKLSGNPDYENLKLKVRILEQTQNDKVSTTLLQTVNTLIDQVILNEDPSLQSLLLHKTHLWFNSHSNIIDIPPQTPVKVLPKRTFSQIRIKKSSKPSQKKDRLPNFDEYRFLKHKQSQLQNWGVSRSRSKEDFLYKSELKSISIERPAAQIRSPGFYSKHLERIYNKHKPLLNPLHFNFDKEYSKELIPNFTPNLAEIENIKKKLSAKQVSVQMKTIEPLLLCESPVRDKLNPDSSFHNLPRGGEGLIRR